MDKKTRVLPTTQITSLDNEQLAVTFACWSNDHEFVLATRRFEKLTWLPKLTHHPKLGSRKTPWGVKVTRPHDPLSVLVSKHLELVVDTQFHSREEYGPLLDVTSLVIENPVE